MINDRISFIRISGLSFMSPYPTTPPYTGLEIPSLNLTSTSGLFEEINSQRKKKEGMVKETEGAIVESSRR
jgi:hypothetical protein